MEQVVGSFWNRSECLPLRCKITSFLVVWYMSNQSDSQLKGLDDGPGDGPGGQRPSVTGRVGCVRPHDDGN